MFLGTPARINFSLLNHCPASLPESVSTKGVYTMWDREGENAKRNVPCFLFFLFLLLNVFLYSGLKNKELQNVTLFAN